MKIHVEFHCDNCDAEGEGFRDEDEVGTEECWQCGENTYVAEPADSRVEAQS